MKTLWYFYLERCYINNVLLTYFQNSITTKTVSMCCGAPGSGARCKTRGTQWLSLITPRALPKFASLLTTWGTCFKGVKMSGIMFPDRLCISFRGESKGFLDSEKAMLYVKNIVSPSEAVGWSSPPDWLLSLASPWWWGFARRKVWWTV